MPKFDYSRLLGLIREKGYTQESLAAKANISYSQLSAKLNGRYPFKQSDIQSISSILNIAVSDIGYYFFCNIG